MNGLSQLVFFVVAVPAFLWAFASIVSSAGTRHSSRCLSGGIVWTHETATRHLRLTTFAVLGLGVTAFFASLLALLS